MAEKQSSKTWVLAVVIVLIIIAALALFYRNEIQAWFSKDKTAQPGAQQNPQTQTNTQTNTTTVVQQADWNKVLRQGVQGPEVGILQYWLGVDQDEKFGPITEGALMDKKGVKQITLNDYDTTPDVGSSWWSSWFGMHKQSPLSNKYGMLDDGFSLSPELVSNSLSNVPTNDL